MYWFLNNYLSCILFSVVFVITFLFPLFVPQISKIENYRQIPIDKSKNNSHKIHWFVQVTDTHLNKLNKTSYSNFEYFCQNVLPLIQPSGVIHTGDIVSSIQNKKYRYRNQQNQEEWLQYKAILERANTKQYGFWVDLRGNHDGNSMFDPQDQENYYYTLYKNTTAAGNMVGQKKIALDQELDLTFITLDLNPYPSISGPIGFFSNPSPSTLKQLDLLLNNKEKQDNKEKKAKQDKQEVVILLTHQPMFLLDVTKQIPNSQQKIKNLLLSSEISLIMNGHYHRRNFYSRLWNSKNNNYNTRANANGNANSNGSGNFNNITNSNSGIVELELADFGYKQYFRIFAFDNGLFSFVDVDMKKMMKANSEQPVILITNPKDSRFLLSKEPMNRLKEIKEIHVLIFSKPGIEKVIASINNKYLGEMKQYKDENYPKYNDLQQLYTLEYPIEEYLDGKHFLNITVITKEARSYSQIQTFSLDGTVSKIKKRIWWKEEFSILFMIDQKKTFKTLALFSGEYQDTQRRRNTRRE
ncbi:helicase related [Anaeramoeba flamelloides]|uniref:Helicase related n=1 Tax=Anaeramoeba flamelloides TaxID=1746091 RepID=A0ABQ8YMK2_9EUKA|nr:helicase related [Anaeramoeba flamelloides]